MLYSPQPMHIPDGFLSLPVSLALWLISILLIGSAVRRLEKTLSERKVPLMGVLAAAIFAGQMLNFAVTGGTLIIPQSRHNMDHPLEILWKNGRRAAGCGR